ncbi:MAG: MlaD family protein, partial [Candidatus Competibacterales bacterium]|nr:MlaD family protein [Candidatus Competibacterales bacterium]
MSARHELPVADLRRRRRWLPWLLPLLAALLAGTLGYVFWQQRGPLITVGFHQGYGLKPGDALRFRGIIVGRVEQVRLDRDLQGVQVAARLQPDAAALARAGARFWIVRPQLDLAGVSGLETVLGANYIGVLPGSGESRQHFRGLEQAPLRELQAPGGLELVLVTAERGGLRPGAPVRYRQVRIGTVVTVELARDASAVEVRAYIEPRFAGLIREQVRFWRSGRVRLDIGLDGFTLTVDNLPTLLLGGVELAIPPRPGAAVADGHRFTLHAGARDEWRDWSPGLNLEPAPTEGPDLLPARLRWRQRSWDYLVRERSR